MAVASEGDVYRRRVDMILPTLLFINSLINVGSLEWLVLRYA